MHLSELSQPLSLRAANRSLAYLRGRDVVAEPSLDLEELEQSAVRATGLSDFGDPWFRRPLRVLLDSVECEAQLNPAGRSLAHAYVRKMLADRLRTARLFAEHPEIRRRPLADPVVVVGPMRSGTTRLHRLLAADKRFTHLRFFEAVLPVPPVRGRDLRPLRAGALLSLLHWFNPEIGKIHPTAPREPEEELGLLAASGWGMNHETQWRVPSYSAWCESEDATPAYRHMADLLRLTSWYRGDDPEKPWVLKTPQHALDLPALLNVFPGARLIFTHRDLAEVVASSCSLVWNHMRLQSDRADRAWIGREWLRKVQLKLQRMAAVEEKLPPGSAIHVDFARVNRDWSGVMDAIYDFLDLDRTPAAAAQEARVASSNRARRFDGHSYRLEDYGLTRERVEAALADGQAGTVPQWPPARAADSGSKGYGGRLLPQAS